jgi:hypothetical protein
MPLLCRYIPVARKKDEGTKRRKGEGEWGRKGDWYLLLLLAWNKSTTEV